MTVVDRTKCMDKTVHKQRRKNPNVAARTAAFEARVHRWQATIARKEKDDPSIRAFVLRNNL
jgi:hypothetical protein